MGDIDGFQNDCRNLSQWYSFSKCDMANGIVLKWDLTNNHENMMGIQWNIMENMHNRRYDICHLNIWLSSTSCESTHNEVYGCFLKWRYPQIIHLTGFSSINHPFWVPPMRNPHIYIHKPTGKGPPQNWADLPKFCCGFTQQIPS